jgi:pimeloyl-ACP methyl ester carboxylesterase
MKVGANGIELEVDVQGPALGEPLLLIMGLGMQLIGWPDELVDSLVAQGFRVIRHDNRDVGLSQGFDQLGVPNVALAALRHRLRLRVRAPYAVAGLRRRGPAG